jgi:hypothetical protein
MPLWTNLSSGFERLEHQLSAAPYLSGDPTSSAASGWCLGLRGLGWGVRVGKAAVLSVRAGAQPFLGPRPLAGRRHDG